MTLKNTHDSWGGVSKLLHWLIVVLILGQGSVGLWMTGLHNSASKIQVYALHKSFGLTILALVVLRALWRLYAGAPAPVPGTPTWQARIATLTHVGLYGLLLVVPLSGWVFNSAAGYPLQWFKLFNLPAIVGRDQALRDSAAFAHEWLFWTLVALALVHAAAAVYHHVFQGDATLTRMLPRRGLRTDPPSPPSSTSP